MGIKDLDYFYTLNPHKLKVIEKCYMQEKKKESIMINSSAYTYGIYVMDALKATVLNMFMKKGSTPYKYPEKPYELDFRTEQEKIEDELSAFVKQQEQMRINWRKAHNKDKESR